MGRTLTATFTFVSDIFVHFSHPVYARSYPCTLSNKKPGFQLTKQADDSSLTSPKESAARWNHTGKCSCFVLYPLCFGCCANPALKSSPRQHPHRHLPLGAWLLSSGRLETALPQSETWGEWEGRGGDSRRDYWGRNQWAMEWVRLT